MFLCKFSTYSCQFTVLSVLKAASFVHRTCFINFGSAWCSIPFTKPWLRWSLKKYYAAIFRFSLVISACSHIFLLKSVTLPVFSNSLPEVWNCGLVHDYTWRNLKTGLSTSTEFLSAIFFVGGKYTVKINVYMKIISMKQLMSPCVVPIVCVSVSEYVAYNYIHSKIGPSWILQGNKKVGKGT
jgi:hypothetical protein